MTPEGTDNDDLADDVRKAFQGANTPTCVRPGEGNIEPNDDILRKGRQTNSETLETAIIYKTRSETTHAAGGALIPLYHGVFEPYEERADELHSTIRSLIGATTANGTIDGADFDAGPVLLVDMTPDSDLGGFDVPVAPTDPAGWIDEAFEDAGGDQ